MPLASVVFINVYVHIDEWGDVHVWILRMDASDDDCDAGEEMS